MLYPEVESIANAQEITLLPGDNRAGVDFHMHRERAYSLKGRIIFSDHLPPKPWSEVTYSQNLLVFRSDRALTSTSLGQEPCQINANAGAFRCDSLLPGEYTFYFEVSQGLGRNTPRQTAKVRYKVPAGAKQTLTVQLQNVADDERYQTPYAGPGGNLDFRKVCATAPDGKPAIRVLVWGQGRVLGLCYYMTFRRNTSFRLPKDYYKVIAFEDAFVPRGHSFGNSSKFEDVLVQHGTGIKLDLGQTIEPSLPVLTTTQLINIALTSLREAP